MINHHFWRVTCNNKNTERFPVLYSFGGSMWGFGSFARYIPLDSWCILVHLMAFQAGNDERDARIEELVAILSASWCISTFQVVNTAFLPLLRRNWKDTWKTRTIISSAWRRAMGRDESDISDCFYSLHMGGFLIVALSQFGSAFWWRPCVKQRKTCKMLSRRKSARPMYW